MQKLVVLTMTLLISVYASGPSFAQESASVEHKKAAQAAIKATGASRQQDRILPQVAEFTKARLIANRPDIESEISEIVDEIAISLAPRRGALEQEIITVYTKNYTLEELQKISEFFSGDVGKKFLDTTPVILRETDEISRVWSQGITRDLNVQVAEKLKEKGLQ